MSNTDDNVHENNVSKMTYGTYCSLEDERDVLILNDKIINHLNIGIFVYNELGKCVCANKKALGIMAVVYSDGDNQNFMDLKDLMQYDLYEQAMVTLETGREGNKTANLNIDEKASIWVNCKFVRVVLHSKPHLLIMADDITDNKNNEDLLLSAKELAEKADKTKSEFIANMSHEIRTPLNAVIGFSEILYSHINEPKHRNYLEAINNAGKALLNIINDILDLSKIETGMIELKLSVINPKIIIDEVISIFMETLSSKGIKLIVDLDYEIPEFLLLDEIRLRQVLLNLIGNAVKFTEKGAIHISMKRLKRNPKPNLMDLVISVEDTGIGIADEDLSRIFESFRQQHQQDTKKYEGTGLGLSISKKLVEIMNGEIKVESKLGVGSIFTVTLTNIEIPEKRVDAIGLGNADHVAYRENKRILVVDDLEINRFLIQEILGGVGYEVISSKSAEEGIRLSESENPALIIMDIVMPDMNGIDATKIIKQNNKTSNIPVIAMTALGAGDESTLENEGLFDGFISKPTNRMKLIGEIEKLIGKAEDVRYTECDNSTLEEIGKKLTEKDRENLYEVLVPLVSSLKLGIKGNKTNELSALLIHYGNEFQIKYFIVIGRVLKEAAECFDIVRVNMCLMQIEKCLFTLRKKGDE